MDAGEQFVIMAGAAMMPGLSASMYIHLSCHLVHCAMYTLRMTIVRELHLMLPS